MTIDDAVTYARYLWHWDWLNDGLPRNMRVGDIDGSLVLPGGWALFLEGKSADASNPPLIPKKGQYMAAKFLSQSPFNTFVFLGGRPDGSEVYWLRVFQNGQDSGWLPTNAEAVKRFVLHWIRDHDLWGSYEIDGPFTSATDSNGASRPGLLTRSD
jgi:hypothetical protein